MKKLLLLFAMCSSLGAWAQTCDIETTADPSLPVADRTLWATLSGDWLNGANADSEIEKLINEIMGFNKETGTFDENKTYGRVIIKSAVGSTVTVKQSLVQQLVTGKNGTGVDYPNSYATEKNYITYLDLSDIAVTEYVGHESASSHNPDATLFCRNGGVSPVKYFAMPSFDKTVADQTYSIPPHIASNMGALDEIILPKNTLTVEHEAFSGVNVPTVKLNVGLEFIGNSAFYASEKIDKETTLDIPSTVKYIGPGAFNFRNISDIYFHSAQAPICPVGKVFADEHNGEAPFLLFGNYTGWGGITGKAQSSGGDDYNTSGVANRMNYKNQDGYWFTMLHFPASADVPNLDISSYKDDTRVYNKVYGSIYYDVNYDKGNLEIGVPGKEQEYIAREKVWAFEGSYDFVGQEEEVMSCDGQTTGLAPSGSAAIPEEAVGKGAVNSGFEDTYRGLNYIWPCQSQYNRAYATVANGYNWDGVTKYRPTLTQDQYDLMKKDGLTVNLNGHWITVGQNIVYDEAWANEYNANLPGAVKEGNVKDTWSATDAIAHNATLDGHVEVGQSAGNYTAEEAIEYNASLPTAIHEGEVKEKWESGDAIANNAALPGARVEGENYYTEASAIAKNATLPGAVSTSDIKEPAVEHQDAVYYTYDEIEWVSGIGYDRTTLVHHDAVPDEYYTWEEYAAANNAQDGIVGGWFSQATFDAQYESMLAGNTYYFPGTGIVKKHGTLAYYEVTADSKQASTETIKIPEVVGHDDIYYTEDQAAEYNAKLPGAVSTEDVEFVYTATEAAEYNATLQNAVKAGDTKSTYTAVEALAHNSNPETNPGAVAENDSKGEYTPETAAAYNAKLDGAVKEGDTKTTYSAQDAIDYNKTLSGNRIAGYSEPSLNDPKVKDYLSMIAFQSTRRIVFADNAGGGDNYVPGIPKGDEAHNWWTICLPFNLTKAQIDKYFGKGTHVCKFNKVERKITGLAAGEKPYVKFYFTADQYVGKTDEQDVLMAHEAYMIFPTLVDYDAKYIADGIPMSEYTKKSGSPKPTGVTANDGTEYRFIGNYDTKLPVSNPDGSVTTTDVVVPQYSYIYAKKNGATGSHPYQFWFTQSAKIKWAPNKCIIQSTSGDRGLTDNNTFFQDSENEAKQISVFGDWSSEDEEETTAIEEDVIFVLGSGEDSEVIYSTSGVKLNSVPQRGVYIKNGKKYMVR